MRKIYCDNGATSYPKAPLVGDSMINYINNIGCNVNRGAYSSSYEAENMVYETRELLCELFDFDKAENAIITANITASLNMVLKGLLCPGDNVIVSSMEHNAVMRPLSSLGKKGVTITKVPCNSLGEINIKDIQSSITQKTKAVVMTHGSNVCGTLLPINEIGQICKDNNIIFIVDSAQTAGIVDISMKKSNIDILCFTGHKGLLGPQGIGGFLIRDEIVPLVDSLIEGGTGSLSEEEIQPTYMPDKYESGTANIPGIYGLNASLKYLKEVGTKNIYEKEMYLTKRFIDGILSIDENLLIGKKHTENRTAVVSLDFKDLDNGIVCHQLDKTYNIQTRSGLHCAPSAHKTLGTFPNGTVRFSFGHFNTVEDIDYVLESIRNIISSKSHM
ncbi:aminotransferase class V-fold PLP-dependent enzyme [Terrisporobacter petrolearius]|uniref:aminotransferase class V-fold PLP-dependent enzyme n=1 Tax=Terrisporobacter petrolearius TaxID=1460447 RepID=UPI0022E83B3B|nr:aminotransferase class V-fold PLP-dependent enzyme [Terrisporobacter petrolearius]